MTDAIAGGRRSALALLVVVGMMCSLLAGCCCLDPDHSPTADPVAVAGQAGASHDDVTAGSNGAHGEQDCRESVAAVAVVVGSASVPGPLVVAVAGAPTAGHAALPPRPGASPEPPGPHLLCVMRT